MQTKMNLYVTITPNIRSRELYESLLPYNANVIDLGDKVYVCAKVDINSGVTEQILDICEKYGDCSISADLVEAKPSSK